MKPFLRCSSLDRLLRCPASRILIGIVESDAIDTGEESGHAMTWRGNWCHWEAARRLVEEHGALSDGPLPAPVLPPDWKPSRWEEASVEWFLQNLLTATPEDHALHVERHLVWDTDTFTLSGHLDCYSISPDGTEVHWNDQKAGLSDVDMAAENWQVAGYGALLKNRYPSVKRGVARIFQKSAPSPISEVEIDDMDRLPVWLKSKVDAALKDNLRLKTHKGCGYCPALFICPAVRKEIEAMEILLTPEEVDKISPVAEASKLAELADRARTIGYAAARIVDAVKERVEAMGPIPLPDGRKATIVEQAGNREVTHPKAAFDLITAKLGEESAWSAMSMSATAIEDQLHTVGGMKLSSKKEDVMTTRRWMKENMAHLISQKPKKVLKFQ